MANFPAALLARRGRWRAKRDGSGAESWAAALAFDAIFLQPLVGARQFPQPIRPSATLSPV